MLRVLVASTLLLAASALVWADVPATQPIHVPTDLTLHNQKDQATKPLDIPAGHRAAVLVFISTDCPISNSYAPAIGELCRAFTSNGIDFFTVYEDSTITPAAASAHHDAYAFPCDALLDPQHILAHATGASVTPEAVVVVPDAALGGVVVYRGRIDDQYVTVGRKRFEATTHELKDALAQLAAGKAVTVAWMRAVGCTIP